VIHHGDDGRHRIYKDGKFFREIWPKTWDPKIRLDDYARFGVQVQVISTVPVMFSYWAKPHHALELHQALNDHTAEACRAYPKHYAGIGTVPLQSPSLAVRELERCMDQLDLQGVQIGSHVNDWNLDAPELFEFFEAASELGAADPRASVGHDGQRVDAQVLAAVARRHARGAIARGVLPGVRRRARAPAQPAQSAWRTAAAASRTRSAASNTASTCGPDLVATDNFRNPREYHVALYFDSWVADPRALQYLLDTCGATA
jgi:aminocarboxymuconate-semialdehyde decarboxylase